MIVTAYFHNTGEDQTLEIFALKTKSGKNCYVKVKLWSSLVPEIRTASNDYARPGNEDTLNYSYCRNVVYTLNTLPRPAFFRKICGSLIVCIRCVRINKH